MKIKDKLHMLWISTHKNRDLWLYSDAGTPRCETSPWQMQLCCICWQQKSTAKIKTQQWFGFPWSQISLKKLQTKHTSLVFPELPVCTPVTGFHGVAILLILVPGLPILCTPVKPPPNRASSTPATLRPARPETQMTGWVKWLPNEQRMVKINTTWSYHPAPIKIGKNFSSKGLAWFCFHPCFLESDWNLPKGPHNQEPLKACYRGRLCWCFGRL